MGVATDESMSGGSCGRGLGVDELPSARLSWDDRRLPMFAVFSWDERRLPMFAVSIFRRPAGETR